MFEPVLRSRGNPSSAAVQLYNDPAFRAEAVRTLEAQPAGRLIHARLPDVAREVHALKARVEALEEALRRA